jgi:penicillin amidase
LAEDLEPVADGGAPAIDDATLAEAARRSERDMRRFPTWGQMHRMQLTHPLGNLPLIGWRYRYGDRPGEGSLTTVMKTGSNLTNRRHRATFGANARHLSDMADPDANYFVLYGGQDGWLRSSTQLDQAPMFLDGRLIRVPMTAEAVEAAFPIVMRFEPSTP